MTRSAHAGEFAQSFRAIVERYLSQYGSWVSKLRSRLRVAENVAPEAAELIAKYGQVAAPDPPDEADLIEEHVCLYLLREVLRALNWLVGEEVEGEPVALVREAPLKSEDGRDLRLDYLGYVTTTVHPLLVVEAKAPRCRLPTSNVIGGSRAALESAAGDALFNAIQHGDDPSEMTGIVGAEWQRFLTKAQRYVEALVAKLGAAPSRYVLSNGDWFVILRTPERLAQPAPYKREDIVVFADRSRVLERKQEFFEELDYFHLTPTPRPVTKPELPASSALREATHLLRGLRVHKQALGRFVGDPIPVIRVSPVILLRQRNGVLLRVDSGEVVDMQAGAIEEHLQRVRAMSDALVELVREVRDVPEMSLQEFFADELAFVAGPACRVSDARDGGTNYELVLGREAHFVRSVSGTPSCPLHSIVACGREAAQPEVRVNAVHPAAYFGDGLPQTCAHNGTATVKRLPVVSVPGKRRTHPGFCEIAPLEERLCCRLCTYEAVCSGFDEFRGLPCTAGP